MPFDFIVFPIAPYSPTTDPSKDLVGSPLSDDANSPGRPSSQLEQRISRGSEEPRARGEA